MFFNNNKNPGKDVAHLEIEIGPSAFGVKCVDTEYEELLCGLDAGNPSKRVTWTLSHWAMFL